MPEQFQETVLDLVKQIPPGSVSTYSAIARELTGSVRAARAVGLALARNPYPIIIPCHRVVMSDGDLGGYSLGLEKKKELLSAEGVEIIGSRVVNLENILFLFTTKDK